MKEMITCCTLSILL
jgi:tetraacyldisaccharide-1-P 4'-kinase